MRQTTITTTRADGSVDTVPVEWILAPPQTPGRNAPHLRQETRRREKRSNVDNFTPALSETIVETIDEIREELGDE